MLAPPAPAFAAAAHRTVLVGTLRGMVGREASARARVRVVLTGASGHRFRAVLTSSACHGLRGCPRGTVRGTWAAIPTPRDAGEAVALSGRGTLRALGALRAVGRAQGTGFVARGRPALWLTLTTGAGSLALRATGPLERGFTPIL